MHSPFGVIFRSVCRGGPGSSVFVMNPSRSRASAHREAAL